MINYLKSYKHAMWVHLKQLYICNKTGVLVIKVGVVCVGIQLLRRLRKELAWATDKCL